MEVYDKLILDWVPYLMFFNKPNFRSNVVNTDSRGFRFSGMMGEGDNLTKSVNVFSGGSTAFGVGSTSDKNTIPSLLSGKTDQLWMNYGGRAHVSTQEWISFAYNRDMINGINNIVIFSGINDLYLYFSSKYFNKRMGTFFSANRFFENMGTTFDFKNMYVRPIINKLLHFEYGGEYDFRRLSNRDSINLLLRKITISQSGLEDIEENTILNHHEEPYEALHVLSRNISNWKIFAEHYNAKLTYVLQPFSNWLCNRRITRKEKSVFDILDNSQLTQWIVNPAYLKINGLHEWYSSQLKSICENENIGFYDSNVILNNNDYEGDIFVDRLHLTDNGNQIISDYIEGIVL